MTKIVSTVARTAVSRVGAKRAMSESTGPRMHKAKDVWANLEATRPKEGHPHVSFNTFTHMLHAVAPAWLFLCFYSQKEGNGGRQFGELLCFGRL